MQIDEDYVGAPPPVEVTFDNLNDNIDKSFLQDMVCVKETLGMFLCFNCHNPNLLRRLLLLVPVYSAVL